MTIALAVTNLMLAVALTYVALDGINRRMAFVLAFNAALTAGVLAVHSIEYIRSVL